MEPAPEHPALRREVERPGTGGPGLVPVLVLAAAMMSTLVAAGMAMTMSMRRGHCPRSGQSDAVLIDRSSFVVPAAPRARAPVARPSELAVPALAPVALDPACAPRVYRGAGEVQEWTYETCASAPMPRHFVVSQP